MKTLKYPLIIVLCLTVLATQVTAAYPPSVYLYDLPSGNKYTVKADTTTGPYWAVRHDGYTAYYNATDAGFMLQQIINAETTYWSVKFSDGTYVLKTKLRIASKDYWTIQGNILSTKFSLAASLGTGNDIFNITDCDRWDMGGFLLYCGQQSPDTYTSRHAIFIDGGDRWFLHDIRVSYPYYDGIHIYGSTMGCEGRALTVYWAGRHGMVINAADSNYYDLNIQSSDDSNLVVGSYKSGGTPAYETSSYGNANYFYGLHSTYSHYQNYNIHGAGKDKYAGVEVYGWGNNFFGGYFDRPTGSGIYLNNTTTAGPKNNAFIGGRVYQANFDDGASADYDVYLGGTTNRTRIVGMELTAKSSFPTLYAVYEVATACNNTILMCVTAGGHATAEYLLQNAGSQAGFNEPAYNYP